MEYRGCGTRDVFPEGRQTINPSSQPAVCPSVLELNQLTNNYLIHSSVSQSVSQSVNQSINQSD